VELTVLMHVDEDVTTTDKLAFDVDLRDGRPLAKDLDTFPEFRILKDIIGGVLHTWSKI